MRALIMFMMILFLTSCHTPGKYPIPLRAQGMNSMDSFRNNFLQGRLCDASFSFEQAVSIFKRVDDMCTLSDAYIQKYLFYAYASNEEKDLLETARDLASIGECAVEMDRIKAIEERSSLSGPSTSSNDIYYSVSLRKKASAEKRRHLAEKALEIDRSHGWTLFIVLDYDLILQLSDDEVEKDRLRKRIKILKEHLQSCD